MFHYAHNPVDWYPGEKPIKAKQRPNRFSYPRVFHLSLVPRNERGLSKRRGGKILNEHFIAIKVDREEA